MQEGTFFGDIIDTGALTTIGKPNVNGPVAYYCDGAGFPAGATGVVAGRLGANQSGSPYVEPVRHRHALPDAPARASASTVHGRERQLPGRLERQPGGRLPRRLQVAHHLRRRRRGTTASPCGATTATRPSSTPATSTAVGRSSPTATRWSWTRAPRPSSSGTPRPASPPRSSTMAPSGSSWTISPHHQPAKCLDAGAGTNGTGIVAQRLQRRRVADLEHHAIAAERRLQRRRRQHRPLHQRPQRQHRRRHRDGGLRLQRPAGPASSSTSRRPSTPASSATGVAAAVRRAPTPAPPSAAAPPA